MPTLGRTLETLDALAPLRLSASWDNTGLLLEGDREIRRALVTIDLTPAVLAEAMEGGHDLVIAYHPPVFRGLKSITRATPMGRTLLDLARNGVHVYSPHTALDAVPGGINDWLLEAFGRVASVRPIEPDAVDPDAGVGRIATLAQPRRLSAVVDAIKAFLGLPAVRVAGDDTWTIRTVATCPGAGGSAFERLQGIDLLLTGEMRHHDVLGFAAVGTATVLTDHTNTERGYLPRYAERIADELGIPVDTARSDADPLRIC
ncbi:MAG: Nif3-like dinuclear metal center hexameric protein [Alphaproteobacteria bacterium]|nr:Nif3-like dinuclear metal center hexameric protein [Alphaproteobacteria bacterium]